MKKSIIYITGALCIILLVSILIKEHNDKIDALEEAKEWKSIAEQEREVPTLNKKAIKFVNALHDGQHQELLTGPALKEYEEAKREHEEFEGHKEHDDGLTDTQSLEVLLSNTNLEEGNIAKSKVLYQLHYKGNSDNPLTGTIDQRILTLVINIDWVKNDVYEVSDYKVTVLQDNFTELIQKATESSDN